VRRVTTIFSRIIDGELPGRFVWRDDEVVAFLTIAPLAPGHTLVVPVEPIDHWIDLPEDLNASVWRVARIVGTALQEAFRPRKVGVLVAGEEVPHAHVHLVPYTDLSQLVFANQDTNPDPAALDQQMELIRATLRAHGHEAAVPD
jgi:histidine triad (HIT) family protein